MEYSLDDQDLVLFRTDLVTDVVQAPYVTEQFTYTPVDADVLRPEGKRDVVLIVTGFLFATTFYQHARVLLSDCKECGD